MDIIKGLTGIIRKILGPRGSLRRSILKCPVIMISFFLAIYVVLPALHSQLIGNIVHQERFHYSDGCYAVVNSYKCGLLSARRSSKIRAYKTVTYYDATGKRIWDLTIDGEFMVDYGHEAEATGADSRVQLFDIAARFIGKKAYTYENTATAEGTVGYHSSVTRMQIRITCDQFGHLM